MHYCYKWQANLMKYQVYTFLRFVQTNKVLVAYETLGCPGRYIFNLHLSECRKWTTHQLASKTITFQHVWPIMPVDRLYTNISTINTQLYPIIINTQKRPISLNKGLTLYGKIVLVYNTMPIRRVKCLPNIFTLYIHICCLVKRSKVTKKSKLPSQLLPKPNTKTVT